ncbi:MAG TPA: Gfo/Idh/MocA family oxidoreductase [Candidatus Paceibacterota bacterium]|nr:Gfo/Idh/MocA family oxidoreductase [Candidatus Paceibacterota bacterium]HRZ54039.1 Gfo/Idh/MocA family oxidoreductase [Candidatus Paceibacterota bacterium]
MNAVTASVLPRRQFLTRAFAVTAPLILPGAVLGLNGATPPSEKIVFGGIGMGNRALYILPNFLSQPDLHFAAISDAREDRRQAGKKAIDAFYRNADCRVYRDFRELLARKDVDAVLIATGNRWHATASMFAARAGKDIYCEKPISLTIREGRELVELCKRYGAIYQAGTQRRSTESYQFARELVRQGKIGKIHTVEMQVWTGGTIPHQPNTRVPEGWDYDQWLGPVQWRPFNPGRVNGWAYFWDTGEGMHTDMGTHYTDQMQWVLGTDHTMPVEFETSDMVWPDPKTWMSETAITGTFKCRYADGVQGILYQRKGFTDRYIRYIGDAGWVQVDDETDVVTAEPKSILQFRPEGGVSWSNASSHIRDLLACIRSRRQPLCHPEVAHRAQAVVESMTIAARLNRKLGWDPVKEVFDCAEANRMLYREPRAPWRV